ncbi:MAG: hypothetical protein V3U26_07500 [Dehalococcoidia bacterium]
MIEAVWIIIFGVMLGLSGGVAFVFLVLQGEQGMDKARMWCDHCNKKHWLEEALVKLRTGPVECKYCGQRSMVTEHP